MEADCVEGMEPDIKLADPIPGKQKRSVIFWIVTGQSGAGKTNVLRILEDWGYFCIDNLPPALLLRTAEMVVGNPEIKRVALGVDVRSRSFFNYVVPALEEMQRHGYIPKILFLEAGTSTLIRRFKETRRRHPMASEGKLLEDIQMERSRLDDLRGRADVVIDTSGLKVSDLKVMLKERIHGGSKGLQFYIYVVSFGYKYGIPYDADLLMDVRFLPNPYYDPKLRPLTGLDAPVKEFVMQQDVSQMFFDKYSQLLRYLVPKYIEEGKSSLVVAIGCTGGQHRSVALAEKLAGSLQEAGFHADVHHRDIERHKENQ